MTDRATQANHSLARIYREGGNFSEVYLDMSVDTSDPPGVQEERRKSVLDALAKAGAPQADLDAVSEALTTSETAQSPVSLYVLVKDGKIEFEELLRGIVVGTERVTYGPVPDVTPVLRTHALDFPYLVVETSRDGGEMRLHRGVSPTAESEERVQGRTDTLHKVKKGGDWRNDHFQNHAVEIWKQTQSQLAGAVDEAVRKHSPRFVVVAGDIRARQLLVDELAPASRAVVTTEPTNTRAPGSSSDALEDRIEAETARVLAEDKLALLDRLNLHDGRGDNLGDTSVGAIVQALASAQVDTLIVDSDRLRGRELLALDGEPWVAAAPEEALGAPVIATVPAELALVRAALLTDARVMFTDSYTAPEEQDRVTLPKDAPVAAVLRWRTGPPVPGT
jgi:hypothetical protein